MANGTTFLGSALAFKDGTSVAAALITFGRSTAFSFTARYFGYTSECKINDIEYEFEGRRLKSVSELMGIGEQKTVDYIYDSNGLIIKKVLGYCYDDDTEMYYCKSRFYVPKWRRWLNSDSINYLEPQNITCLNLFAYCNNNPVMYVDENGNMPKWLKITLIASIAAIAIASMVATCGMAASGAGFLASMTATYMGASAAVSATAATAASIGVYATAALSSIAITSFADAEIQQTISGNNYMSWLGDSYDSVKGVAYSIAFAMPMLAEYAPIPSSSNTGCYLIKRGNKVVYVGKGSMDRMYTSMRNHCGTSWVYYPCTNEKMAFANEAFFMQHYGVAISMNGILENKINSPGLKLLFEWI